jgi:hypothetical protein
VLGLLSEVLIRVQLERFVAALQDTAQAISVELGQKRPIDIR